MRMMMFHESIDQGSNAWMGDKLQEEFGWSNATNCYEGIWLCFYSQPIPSAPLHLLNLTSPPEFGAGPIHPRTQNKSG
jgi:hypothetical protein